MMAKPYRSKTVQASSDLVTDTAILLQQAGVHRIDRAQLSSIVHGQINSQELVDRAQAMFVARQFQGLITLDGLVGAILGQAA